MLAGAAPAQVAPALGPTAPPQPPPAPPAQSSQGGVVSGPLGLRPEPIAPPAPGATPPAPDVAALQRPVPAPPQRVAAPAPRPPAEPLKRPRYASAILQGVDKITAETLRFEAKVGEPVRYKGLILTVHACETAAADEDAPEAAAHLEVQSQPEILAGGSAPPPRLVYRGWMFASSPTLHPFEHPVYDLWLIACRTDGPAAPGSSR